MPTKFFGTVRPKNFDGKTWFPLFHPYIFWKPKIFSKIVGFPYESFGHCETWKFRLEIVIRPLLSINFFRYQKISGKTEGFLYKAFRFGPVRQKFDKTVMPPSYAWKFSIKEFFWSTKVFSNEIFQYSETKTPTENRDTAPPPLSRLFRYPKLLVE